MKMCSGTIYNCYSRTIEGMFFCWIRFTEYFCWVLVRVFYYAGSRVGFFKPMYYSLYVHGFGIYNNCSSVSLLSSASSFVSGGIINTSLLYSFIPICSALPLVIFSYGKHA